MSTAIIPAIVAAGVSLYIVFLGRMSETIRQLQSMRTSAYADFVRGIAGLAIVQSDSVRSREQFIKESEMLILVAEAKARIAIYGGESVIHSMASFLRGGSVLNSPEIISRFTALCQEMRSDSQSRKAPGKVENRDVSFLLFGE